MHCGATIFSARLRALQDKAKAAICDIGELSFEDRPPSSSNTRGLTGSSTAHNTRSDEGSTGVSSCPMLRCWIWSELPMVMARSARIRCQPVTPEPGKSCCPNGSIEIRFMSLTLDKVATPVESALSNADGKHGASLMTSVYPSPNLTVHHRSRSCRYNLPRQSTSRS